MLMLMPAARVLFKVCAGRRTLPQIHRAPPTRPIFMKQKTESKQTESRQTERERVMSDMADKAMRNYDQIVRTGLKIQEEASRCWSNMVTHGASAQDWQRPFSAFASVANSVLPKAQRSMQELLEVAEKNSRTGVDLMRKAAEAMQTPGLAERQAKWMEVWASSLGAARANADAMMQLGSRALDTWIDLVQKNSEVTQMRESKTTS
jgi:hypothetical protein